MKILYYINPLTHRTIKSTGRIYKSLKARRFHMAKDKCLYNSKYAEKCLKRLGKKYPEFDKSKFDNSKYLNDSKLQDNSDLNYIEHIKETYPHMIKNPNRTQLKSLEKHEQLGFILHDDKIMGYIDIEGNLRKFEPPLKLDERLSKSPFIISLDQEDKDILLKLIEEKGIITDSTPLDTTIKREQQEQELDVLNKDLKKIYDEKLSEKITEIKNKINKSCERKLSEIESSYKIEKDRLLKEKDDYYNKMILDKQKEIMDLTNAFDNTKIELNKKLREQIKRNKHELLENKSSKKELKSDKIRQQEIENMKKDIKTQLKIKHDNELSDINNKHMEAISELKEKISDLEKEKLDSIKTLQKELKDKQSKLEFMESQKEQIHNEYAVLINQKTKEITDKLNGEFELKLKETTQTQELQQKEYDSLKKEYDRMMSKEIKKSTLSLNESCDNKLREIESIYDKQQKQILKDREEEIKVYYQQLVYDKEKEITNLTNAFNEDKRNLEKNLLDDIKKTEETYKEQLKLFEQECKERILQREKEYQYQQELLKNRDKNLEIEYENILTQKENEHLETINDLKNEITHLEQEKVNELERFKTELADANNQIEYLQSQQEQIQHESDILLQEKIQQITNKLNSDFEEQLESKINELKKQHELELKEYDSLKTDYDVLMTSKTNEILLIKKEFNNQLDHVKHSYENAIYILKENNENCKRKITEDKAQILMAIQQYRQQVEEFIQKQLNGNKINHKKIQELNSLLRKEKEVIKARLNKLMKPVIETNQDNLTFAEREDLKQKTREINELNNTIIELHAQIDNINITKRQVEEAMLMKFKTSCFEKIVKEKEYIIKAIDDYNQKWMNYVNQTSNTQNDNKDKLKSQLDSIGLKIKEIISFKNDVIGHLRDRTKKQENQLIKLNNEYNKLKETKMFDSDKDISALLTEKEKQIHDYEETVNNLNQEIIGLQNDTKLANEIKNADYEKLKQDLSASELEIEKLKRQFEENIKEIELKIKKTITDQFIEESNRLRQAHIEQENLYNDTINIKNNEILALKKELEQVKELLRENGKQQQKMLEVDTDNCFQIISNFAVINNVFKRKTDIISILESIIYENKLGLSEGQYNIITTRFESVKAEIYKYINFLDLERYLNDPNREYFKSKATLNKISPDYCNDLENLSIYWNENKHIFQEQDRILTNLYEDLSGAVRVYIKIKPLLSGQTQAIQYELNDTHTQITVRDVDTSKTFGNFYYVYEPEYTNVDAFLGRHVPEHEARSLKLDTSTIDETYREAIYNSFKQVEDGYSIVMFGYGASGSGKTYVLLGDQYHPGLIHYGLANLSGYKSIKIKNIFEQYIHKYSPNTNNITGKIHNLVGSMNKLREASVNEQDEFSNYVLNYVNKDNTPIDFNFNDVKISKITDLFNCIEQYRIKHKRVKSTPNNPVSSRSHLFIIFEIEFNSGKVGHITMVDAAGREDPQFMFDTFIDSKKTNITSLISVYGAKKVAEFLKPEFQNNPTYPPENIFEILNEAYYITETLNHLVYFFNTKNHIQTKVIKQKGPESYSTSKYFVNPKDEIEGKIMPFNNCLTLPIMNYLDFKDTSTEFKPNKYIMMVCIRQDQLNTAFPSLEFANSIKST
jgi:hypothetical protein